MAAPSKKLISIITEMCGANDMVCAPVANWPTQANVETLNAEAEKLPEADVYMFTDGLDTDVAELVEKHSLHALSLFLNDIFEDEIKGVML